MRAYFLVAFNIDVPEANDTPQITVDLRDFVAAKPTAIYNPAPGQERVQPMTQQLQSGSAQLQGWKATLNFDPPLRSASTGEGCPRINLWLLYDETVE